MAGILRRLQGRGFVAFEDLFEAAAGVPGMVVNFLAVLELARERLLEITQNEALAPIYVRLAVAADATA
jgi:segregation and condensation protein A